MFTINDDLGRIGLHTLLPIICAPPHSGGIKFHLFADAHRALIYLVG